MIYEDRGSERKRKERKHLQQEIQMCFAAASYVEFESFCFYIFTFAFRRLHFALFLSSFQGGCVFRRPSSRRRRRCDDIRASPRIFPKPPPLDNEQSFRRALCSRGFFVFFVLGIGGCFSSPPPTPHPTIHLTLLLLLSSTYLSDLSNVGLSYLLFFSVRIPFEGCSSSL